MRLYILTYVGYEPNAPVRLVTDIVYTTLDAARTDLENYILKKEGRTKLPTDPLYLIEQSWTPHLECHIHEYGSYEYYTPDQDFQYEDYDVNGQTITDIVGPVKRYEIQQLIIDEKYSIKPL